MPKRVFALIAAVLALLAVSCLAAQPLLIPVQKTPYDEQMTRVRRCLIESKCPISPAPSLDSVNHWMATLRNIPYRFSLQWRTPEEVIVDSVADCKGKALALYQEMYRHGAESLRLVIGKRAPTSTTTHAWVEWETMSGRYVLDPTINSNVLPAEQVPSGCYTAYYAFSGVRKYSAMTPLFCAML